MECIACKREKYKKENPEAIISMNALLHTCNQPERSKREDNKILDAEFGSNHIVSTVLKSTY